MYMIELKALMNKDCTGEQAQGELTKSASIIPKPLTWTSVQNLGFSGVVPSIAHLTGGTHGCYYFRGLDQKVLSPSQGPACCWAFAASAGGHYCLGDLWCHRR